MKKLSLKNFIILTVALFYIIFSGIVFLKVNNSYYSKNMKKFIDENNFLANATKRSLEKDQERLINEGRVFFSDKNLKLMLTENKYLESWERENGKLKLNISEVRKSHYERLIGEFTLNIQDIDSENAALYKNYSLVAKGTKFSLEFLDKGNEKYMSDALGGKKNFSYSTDLSFFQKRGGSFAIKTVSPLTGVSFVEMVIVKLIDWKYLEEIKNITNKEILLVSDKKIVLSTLYDKNNEKIQNIFIEIKDNQSELFYNEFSINGEKMGFTFFPIVDYENEKIGYLGVGGGLKEIYNQYLDNIRDFILFEIGSIVFLLILLIVIFRREYIDIRRIFDRILTIERGEYQKKVDFNSRKELNYLMNSIDNLSEAVEKRERELELTNNAYDKFVPHEFLNLLEREKIWEVRLGDHVLKNMTIIFADIRSFTTLSEKMTPDENFYFLNSYLKNIVPIIRENKGIVDKYIGDAIMALFQNKVDDAIKSAIAMQKKIREINIEIKKFNVEKINIGIGIHTGTLMLGIIGEENRLEGTVIADAVNLASRMEGLTKHYGASILISEDVYNGIEQKEKYNIIYIDEVKVYGKEKQISIYEVIDGIDDEEFKEKLGNRDEFEKGVYLYQNCKIEKAQIIFDNLLKKSKYSKTIRLYKERCERDGEKCIDEENYYVEKLDEK